MNLSFREFLQKAEAQDLVMRLAELPLMAIPAAMEQAEKAGKILVVEKPEGFQNPVVYNVAGNQKLLALAFDCAREDVVRKFSHGTEHPVPPLLCTDAAPVQEQVLRGDEADITRLPFLVHSKKDGGRYISAGVVVARDPENGVRNLSFNRMQLKGPRKLGIRMMPTQDLGRIQQKYEAMNQPMPVAVVLGNHPLELVAASTSPRPEVDEYDLAGGFRQSPLPLVKCKTVDLEVPAHAEIIIEGEVLPKVREEEGPFGDFMGYYVPVMENHILRVTAITMRKNAYVQAMKAGSTEDSHLLGLSREAVLLKAIEVTGVKVRALSLSPMIFNAAVSIEKRYEHEAKTVIMAAFGAYHWLKFCVVTDHDVDIFDKNDLWWAMGTRCRPDVGSVVISEIPGFPRDPYHIHQSKLGIDATAPLNAWDEFERISIPTLEDGITYPY